jgi:dTDP-4-dehydrorhamnose reductase
MKILVVGGGGQLGVKILQQGKDKHSLYSTYLTRKPSIDESYRVDKTHKASIQDLIKKIKPDAVIDTAAIHNVDRCETNKEEAHLVNVEGTKNVAEACRTIDAKLVYISTDFVFDGRRGNYLETDRPLPINYYGQSKLEGEEAVRKTCENYCIVRTSVIYSWKTQAYSISSSGKPMNYAMWAIQKLVNREPLKIVNDQYSTPTLADSLSQTLLKLVEADQRGTYNITGKTRLDRFTFTIKLAEKMGYDVSLITPISSSELVQTAPRPRDSSLNVTKIEATLKTSMLTIDDALLILRNQSLEESG